MPGVLNSIRVADVADILIVAAFLYVILRWAQTTATRGLTMGAAVFVGVYLAAVEFSLHLTTLLFQFGMTIAAVALVVVFQNDIRRTVERILLASRWAGRNGDKATRPHVDTLLEAAFHLAKNRRGALIVIAGEESLDAHLEGGTELVGQISQPLLDSLFDPHSAGHDGAVVIQRGFVTRFGVHLPLSENREKSAGLGTRHRSGLGLSECSDALVAIVSEERGQVSLAYHGELRRDLSRNDVREAFASHLAETSAQPRQRVTSLLLRHPRTKLFALLLSFVAWLSFAADHDLVQRVFVVPIEYRNVPKEMTLPESVPTEARITFSATDRAFQFVAPSTLKVSLDLSEAARGKDVFTLTESSVRHPATLTVYRIEPRVIRLKQ